MLTKGHIAAVQCRAKAIIKGEVSVSRLRTVRDVCEDVDALAAELQRLEVENSELKKHLESFACFAATCRRDNTDEWMRMMVDQLNGVSLRVDPDAEFYLDGDSIRIRKAVSDADQDGYD